MDLDEFYDYFKVVVEMGLLKFKTSDGQELMVNKDLVVMNGQAIEVTVDVPQVQRPSSAVQAPRIIRSTVQTPIRLAQ